MCDYSLEHIAFRPAEAGETLELRGFHTGSPGFISKAAEDCAVCITAGSLLRLTMQDAEYGDGVEDVLFIKTQEGPYHDAIRMADGSVRKLSTIDRGTKVKILMLANADAMEDLKVEPNTGGAEHDVSLVATY